ncbi:MAG: hypothetical protein QXW83_00150 [Nitrososphaerales archaeon]
MNQELPPIPQPRPEQLLVLGLLILGGPLTWPLIPPFLALKLAEVIPPPTLPAKKS